MNIYLVDFEAFIFIDNYFQMSFLVTTIFNIIKICIF